MRVVKGRQYSAYTDIVASIAEISEVTSKQPFLSPDRVDLSSTELDHHVAMVSM